MKVGVNINLLMISGYVIRYYIYDITFYNLMSTRLSITVPDEQAEYLRKHREIRASGLLQGKIRELMRNEKKEAKQ